LQAAAQREAGAATELVMATDQLAAAERGAPSQAAKPPAEPARKARKGSRQPTRTK